VTNSPVVEIEALTRCFGAFTAVDSLTLTANAGEVFGPHSSNKTGIRTLSFEEIHFLKMKGVCSAPDCVWDVALSG
jgi:ABC-type uncharacterized transport system ATPase subunit